MLWLLLRRIGLGKHALLTLCLFSLSPAHIFSFVSLFLSSPLPPFSLLRFKLHFVSYCDCSPCIFCSSSFDLPTLFSPLPPQPTPAHPTLHSPHLRAEQCCAPPQVSLLMCGLLHTVQATCQTSTRRMFYTQLNSTLNWLTDRAF